MLQILQHSVFIVIKRYTETVINLKSSYYKYEYEYRDFKRLNNYVILYLN